MLDEILVGLCAGLFLYFRKDVTYDEKKQVGWVIIGIILVSTAKNLAIALYYAWLEIRDLIKEFMFKSDNESDSPATSDVFSERMEETGSDIKSEVERLREEKRQAEEQGRRFSYSDFVNVGQKGPPLN